VTGVTGAREELSKQLRSDVRRLKKLTAKPVCVGFGISGSRQAKDVARVSDGVIVGSALIKVLEKNLGNKKKLVAEMGKFAGSIAKAVHGV
jgi:tryptophan synthase alpha chain